MANTGALATVRLGLRVGLIALRGSVAAALGLAVFGSLHPAGDSLSVVQLPLSIAGLFLGAFRYAPSSRAFVVAASVLALGQVALEHRAPRPAGDFAVYQKNLLHLNPTVPKVTADIRMLRPEVVTLQEVTARLDQDITQDLGQAYPTRAFCPVNATRGTAVFSRWPVIPDTAFCASGGNLAGVQVNGPMGPVWLLSLHLNWPWPREQGDQVKGILADIASLKGPILLGGDFNMVPWSDAVASIARATGTQRAGGVVPTFVLSGIGLPIDHVLAPGGGSITQRPMFSSDHFGLLAQVSLSPDP